MIKLFCGAVYVFTVVFALIQYDKALTSNQVTNFHSDKLWANFSAIVLSSLAAVIFALQFQ